MPRRVVSERWEWGVPGRPGLHCLFILGGPGSLNARDTARALSEENVEIVRRVTGVFLAGVQRGDPGAVFDTDALADDAEWVVPRFPQPEPTLVLRGREEFVDWFRTWTEDFEDWAMRIERVLDAGGDRVVVVTQQSATGKRAACRSSLIAA
jgi:ketosteroid isomerase-like protein